MVSVLLKHAKVRVKAVRVKQPYLFSASWGKYTNCCHSQSMLLGDRLRIALSLPKRCARRTCARTVPKTLHCEKRKKSTQCAGFFFSVVKLWMFGALKSLFHWVNWPNSRIIVRGRFVDRITDAFCGIEIANLLHQAEIAATLPELVWTGKTKQDLGYIC